MMFADVDVIENAEAVSKRMRRVVQDYPESAYAPFAAVILARHELRVEEGQVLRPAPETLRELMWPTFDHHTEHPLHAEALYLMFQATSRSRAGAEATAEAARRLVEEHPYSRWADKVREISGEDNTYNLPPRPARSAATQPAATQPAEE